MIFISSALDSVLSVWIDSTVLPEGRVVQSTAESGDLRYARDSRSLHHSRPR